MARETPSHGPGGGGGGGEQPLLMVVLSEKGFAIHQLPTAQSCTVGRSESCEVTIVDASISRRHAEVVRSANQLLISDLGSANGTYIGERPLDVGDRVAASPGEIITFGAVKVVIYAGSLPLSPRRAWPHRYFERRVEEECVAAQRGGDGFSVLRIQCRSPDDDRGLLVLLAKTLGVHDVLGRYAAGDYEVLLRESQPGRVETMSDRIAAELDKQSIGVEIGRATFGSDGETVAALLAIAANQPATGTELTTSVGSVTSGVMRGLLRMVERVAKFNLTILLVGETGVGKEVMAEQIHEMSDRQGPFLRLNCAALTESLLESQLFGHDKGAFTGADRDKPGLLESADGGTVFLDEIGELPLAIQAKFLRVLEERMVLRVGGVKPRSIDVRFVAATNRDLEAEVEAGRFRSDLLFRINGITLVIPPLRERIDEILPLARSLVESFAEQINQPVPDLSLEVKRALESYSWPGNVRELRNIIERASVLCEGGQIEIEHLPMAMREASSATDEADSGRSAAAEATADQAQGSEERAEIIDALARHGGNQHAAAAELGIHRRTLMRRMDLYDIPRPRKGKKKP